MIVKLSSAPRQASTEEGFTLLEVLVALVIFAVVMAGMGPAFLGQIRHNHRAERQTEAIGAAEQVLDSYRLMDPGSIPSTGNATPQTISIDGSSYEVRASFCLTSSFCNTTMRHITVSVWFNNEELFQTESVFTQLQ